MAPCDRDSDCRRLGLAAIPAVLFLVLASCMTQATPYKAAANDRDDGYSVQRVEANRYRVAFRGNASTSRQTVDNYLLYRAAEVTLENGDDYFIVANKETESTPSRTGGVSFGIGGFSFGGGSSVGGGIGASTAQSGTEYEAVAMIEAFRGPKPDGQFNVYDAHDIVQRLRFNGAAPARY